MELVMDIVIVVGIVVIVVILLRGDKKDDNRINLSFLWATRAQAEEIKAQNAEIIRLLSENDDDSI